MSSAAPDDFPDLNTFVLPSRAYLLSYRDQALPARRAALADARSYFDEVGQAGDHESQLALLGLVGEALQVVEDVGVLANALMAGIPGLSFYVRATAYEPKNVNNFFGQAKKRDQDYYLQLAALRFGSTSITDQFHFTPSLEPADQEAIEAAERGTAMLLRDHTVWLAEAWERYRQFFHAFKHGALLANPEHVQLVRNREEVIARVAVWRRRRSSAELGAHSNMPLAELANYADLVGGVGLDMLEYIVDTRLSIFELIRFTEEGGVEMVKPSTSPWDFWFRREDVEPEHVTRLEQRFGIRFEAPTSRA